MDAAFSGTISYGMKEKAKPWRTDAKYYKRASDSKPVPGNINFAPAWFQQGNYVRLTFHAIIMFPLKPHCIESEIVTRDIPTFKTEAHQSMHMELVGRYGGNVCTDGCFP